MDLGVTHVICMCVCKPRVEKVLKRELTRSPRRKYVMRAPIYLQRSGRIRSRLRNIYIIRYILEKLKFYGWVYFESGIWNEEDGEDVTF